MSARLRLKDWKSTLMAGLSPWESAGRTKASLDPELVFALINQWEASRPHSHTPPLGVCLRLTASVNSERWGDKTNTQTEFECSAQRGSAARSNSWRHANVSRLYRRLAFSLYVCVLIIIIIINHNLISIYITC